MLYATNRFPGDGVTTQYEISFVGGYLDRTHVKAYIKDASRVQTPVPLTQWNFLGPYTIRGIQPIPVGSTLVIYRDTPKAPIVDFVNGSRMTEANLDTATRQGTFVAAEGADAVSPTGVAGFLQIMEDFHSASEVASAQAVAASSMAIERAYAAQAGATAAQSSAWDANTSKVDAAASASAAGGSAAVAYTHELNAAVASTSAASAANTAVSIANAVLEAQTQTNALLGIGIGTSYVDGAGDLIMTYNAVTSSISINADGILQLTY